MFDFEKFKLTMSDSLTLGFSTSSTILDYYLKDDSASKQQEMINFNKKVLQESQAAKENNIYYNTYLTTSSLEAESMRAENNIKKSASEAIANGAATGMEGAALTALVRESQAAVLRAQGEIDFKQQQAVEQGQRDLDNSVTDYNNQAQQLAYKEDQIDEPSIFSSIVTTGTKVVSAMKSSEQERRQAEYYNSRNTPTSGGSLSTLIKTK